MTDASRLSNEGQGAGNQATPPGPAPAAPGAIRVAPGTIELNVGRAKLTLVIVNTGDRPVQIGSHLHLPDANTALAFDREAAAGFRLDIPSGTSQRFEPGASREVVAVALAGNRLVPGIQVKTDG
jgi:urease beta subunit